MPVDVFPEFAPPLVEIQTEGIGMTAAEVEELITIPIEDALSGTPGLDVMRSSSVTASRRSRLIFKPGTDCWSAPAGAGARRAGDRGAAAVGRHAGDAAAAVGDQPGHEDRALLEDDCR